MGDFWVIILSPQQQQQHSTPHLCGCMSSRCPLIALFCVTGGLGGLPEGTLDGLGVLLQRASDQSPGELSALSRILAQCQGSGPQRVVRVTGWERGWNARVKGTSLAPINAFPGSAFNPCWCVRPTLPLVHAPLPPGGQYRG